MPAGSPPICTVADRPGCRGLPAGSPRRQPSIARPDSSVSSAPFASKKSNALEPPCKPSPATPASAIAKTSRSSTGSPGWNT